MKVVYRGLGYEVGFKRGRYAFREWDRERYVFRGVGRWRGRFSSLEKARLEATRFSVRGMFRRGEI